MTLKQFALIAHSYSALSLIVLVTSLLYFNKRPTETKIIALLFLFSCLPYAAIFGFGLKGMSVNLPQNIYLLGQMLALSLLFSVALEKKHRRLLLVVGLIFTVFWFVNILFFQKEYLNTYTKAVGSIIIIFYCLLYYHRLLTDLPVQDLHRVPMFWYVTSHLIFCSATLFLFLFMSYLTKVLHDDLLIYWSFHNILNIILNLMVLVGLWLDLRNIRLRS